MAAQIVYEVVYVITEIRLLTTTTDIHKVIWKTTLMKPSNESLRPSEILMFPNVVKHLILDVEPER